MGYSHWNNWYMGWGWFLWTGILLLMISSFGYWGYSYRVHRRNGEGSHKAALEILNERYARGEITREEFLKMKSEITSDSHEVASNSQRIKVTPNSSPT